MFERVVQTRPESSRFENQANRSAILWNMPQVSRIGQSFNVFVKRDNHDINEINKK